MKKMTWPVPFSKTVYEFNLLDLVVALEQAHPDLPSLLAGEVKILEHGLMVTLYNQVKPTTSVSAPSPSSDSKP